MEQENVRTLYANEIECRVGTISDKGLSLLLYKDARVDMKMLDEIYGVNNWQRKHEVIGGNLYCIVSIWDEKKKQWISKMDVGTKSRTEMEKGESSDAFKRACVNWGIGRELYTAPFVWIGAGKCKIQMKDNKYTTYDKFSVSSISYNENREITGLVIVNQEGRVVYSLVDKATNDKEKVAPITPPTLVAAEPESDHVVAINKELERTGVALDAVLSRYGVTSISEMDDSIYKKAMTSLKRTKSKAA